MYIPLFNRTSYTLLSSLIKIDDLIEYAKNLGRRLGEKDD